MVGRYVVEIVDIDDTPIDELSNCDRILDLKDQPTVLSERMARLLAIEALWENNWCPGSVSWITYFRTEDRETDGTILARENI